MRKKHRRLLISLLVTMAFFAGCVVWSYAEDDPSADKRAGGDAGFGFTLEQHSLDHQEGFFWGVTDDTDDSTYSSLTIMRRRYICLSGMRSMTEIATGER